MKFLGVLLVLALGALAIASPVVVDKRQCGFNPHAQCREIEAAVESRQIGYGARRENEPLGYNDTKRQTGYGARRDNEPMGHNVYKREPETVEKKSCEFIPILSAERCSSRWWD